MVGETCQPFSYVVGFRRSVGWHGGCIYCNAEPPASMEHVWTSVSVGTKKSDLIPLKDVAKLAQNM